MTDLQITKLCGNAMSMDLCQRNARKSSGYWSMELCKHYDPLHDDAQAMALVKKFALSIDPSGTNTTFWLVSTVQQSLLAPQFSSESFNLNEAICECVAKMQASKERK